MVIDSLEQHNITQTLYLEPPIKLESLPISFTESVTNSKQKCKMTHPVMRWMFVFFKVPTLGGCNLNTELCSSNEKMENLLP